MSESWSRRRPTATAVDVVAATLLALSVVVAAASGTAPVPAALAGIVASASVAVRRRNPLLTTVVAGVAGVVADHTGGSHLAVAAPALALSYYTLGRDSALRHRRSIYVVWLALPLPAIAVGPNTASGSNPLLVDVVSIWAFFIMIPFAAGRVVGARAALNDGLRANTERLAEEQRRHERQVATEERTRIARELHDVIAHSVSVMVIQAGAARRVVGRKPEVALEAMRTVEHCGRDALLDLRRMIGVLRRDELQLSGDMDPGLAQLDRLADRARVAGLPVQVRVDGEPRPLSAALDLVTYRVVQEALTNAIKHAGPARARVVVSFLPDSLELEIVDTGRGRAGGAAESGGQGLIGMRERLALCGGRLEAGRRPEGGYRVKAHIPLSEVVPA